MLYNAIWFNVGSPPFCPIVESFVSRVFDDFFLFSTYYRTESYSESSLNAAYHVDHGAPPNKRLKYNEVVKPELQQPLRVDTSVSIWASVIYYVSNMERKKKWC